MKTPAVFLIVLILFFPCCACVAAPAQRQEVALTMDEAVALALRQNRDVLLKAQDVIQAKARISEARALLLPSLNATATITDTAGLYNKAVTADTVQLTLKQYLYRGGRTINTIQQNEYLQAVAAALLDKTKLETALSVKKAFYTLLLARKLAEINRMIVENTQSHLAEIEARYKTGEVPEADILDIRSALAAAQEASDAALHGIESGQMVLKNLLFLGNDVIVSPQGEFTYAPKEVAFEEGFLEAMRMRPEIRQYEAQEQAQREAVEIAKAEARPTIYASWDYYGRSHATLSFTPTRGRNDYTVLGATFSWPVFDGWASRAKVEQALADLAESRLSKEKTAREIALELKTAYLALKDAIAKMKKMQAEIARYADRLSASEQQYRRGIASALAVEDARLSYRVAEYNTHEAIYDYTIAQAGFAKATGGL